MVGYFISTVHYLSFPSWRDLHNQLKDPCVLYWKSGLSRGRQTVERVAERGTAPDSPALPAEYEGVIKSFRTGCQERELQIVQLSVTRCNCIAICESV
jgi:hypothetical protein